MTKITLDSVTPSINEIVKWHWGKVRRYKTNIQWDILAEIKKMGMSINPVGEVKRYVKFVVHRKRRFDPDNHKGGLKYHVDSLRKLGLIYNDSLKWIHLETEQIINQDRQYTEIFICDFDEWERIPKERTYQKCQLIGGIIDKKEY